MSWTHRARDVGAIGRSPGHPPHKRFHSIHHTAKELIPAHCAHPHTHAQPRRQRTGTRAGEPVAGSVEEAGHKLSGANLPLRMGNLTVTTLAPDVGAGFPHWAQAPEIHGGGKPSATTEWPRARSSSTGAFAPVDDVNLSRHIGLRERFTPHAGSSTRSRMRRSCACHIRTIPPRAGHSVPLDFFMLSGSATDRGEGGAFLVSWVSAANDVHDSEET